MNEQDKKQHFIVWILVLIPLLCIFLCSCTVNFKPDIIPLGNYQVRYFDDTIDTLINVTPGVHNFWLKEGCTYYFQDTCIVGQDITICYVKSIKLIK